jgi:peptidoglycan/xylan/chitin deacetylase (PgdA/CDA1 family)
MALTKKVFYKNRNAIITTSFDDGGKLDLKVAELLKKYDLNGTFYIVLDWIGQEGYLNWEDIKQLDKEGFEIGSHTITHPSDLKMVFDEQLHYEIQNSKDLLETALGHKIASFCYPRGRADERVKNKVKESGYKTARGTGKVGITSVADKYYLPGTIHIYQREEYGELSILEYAKLVINKVRKNGGYVNIWGHSKEIERDQNWKTLDKVLSYIKNTEK